MQPTTEWLAKAQHTIRELLLSLRPQLLESQGTIKHTLKTDRTIVTAMDVLVENKLRDTLAAFDGGVGFGGEESGADTTQRTFWLVDPIDGTESFTRGMPFCTNIVALIDQGEVVMGVVYNFMLDEYYLAVKGQGATCNGHMIRVSERPMDRSYVMLTGKPFAVGMPRDTPSLLRPLVRGLPKLHASGYELAAIAKGAYDGMITAGAGGPWDFAAGSLLVREAGGIVQNIGSETYDYRNLQFIAGTPSNFDGLKQFVADNQTTTVA